MVQLFIRRPIATALLAAGLALAGLGALFLLPVAPLPNIDIPTISVSASMLRRCPKCSGVSRTIRISLRRSFKHTSAARMSRFELSPAAIADILCTEQGAITMPSTGNDPLAKRLPMSSIEYAKSARALKSCMFRTSSRNAAGSHQRSGTPKKRWSDTDGGGRPPVT